MLSGALGKYGDFDGAIRLLRVVTVQSPDFAEARLNLGLLLQRNGQLAEAVAELQKVHNALPQNPQAALALGIALAENEQAAEAIEVLRKAAALEPRNPTAHYNLGLALAKADDTAQAVEAFRKAVELRPNRPDARRGLGAALQRAGDLEGARAELEAAVRADPGDAEAFSTLGALLLRIGDTDAAVGALEKSIAANPKLIKTYRTLAQALFKARRKEEASWRNQQAEDLTQERTDLGRAMVLMDSARQQLARKETAEAVAQLREAVSLRPQFAEAQVLLASTLRATPDGDAEALEILESVLDANPDHARARYEKGVTLDSLNRHEEALKEYQAAARIAPSLMDARRALAANALQSQDWCAAAAESRAVLSWEPGDPKAREVLRSAEQKVTTGALACPSP
jgi:Flp pilus assembly protein TadD